MVFVAQADSVVFEIEDNYQKQTYRNRAYIAHANGKLALNVPIKHSKTGNRQKTKEVQVENNFPWQSQHWKSLQTAYRTSPFFEFYEDDLYPLFENRIDKLMDHNLLIYNTLCELIGLDGDYEESNEYFKKPTQKDLRYLVDAKKKVKYPLEPYAQVLESHHGFISNLSILDLLFNQGPNTLNYLESQRLTF